MTHDARPDTYDHIGQVRGLLLGAANDLLRRGHRHDHSKLVAPEKEGFDRCADELRGLTFGSPEYKAAAEKIEPILIHHYAANDHHPQHFGEGWREMNLLQVTEMLCDWIAATRRHDNGDIHESIDINAERFEFTEDFKRLLLNTVDELLLYEVKAVSASA